MSYLYSEQGEALFKPIHSYLKRYRQYIEEKDITVNNGVIYLELNGRRTNLNSLFLLGFHSVGRTVEIKLQKNGVPFREVQIIIHYEMKNPQHIAVTASMESVVALSRGKINPDQFFNEVRY
tara:strand:- start:99 stop:464 length:366 start_codon:yes stop_codon:yes gene_type:complete